MTSPLLRYSLTPAPFPLQASGSASSPEIAVLTLAATNPVVTTAYLQGIEVVIPADLCLPGKLDVVGPVPQTAGWKYDQAASDPANGKFAFLPDSPPFEVQAGGLIELVFQNLEVRDRPGLSTVAIDEVSGKGVPFVRGSVGLPVTRFPNGWGDVQFWATDPNLPYPGKAELNWRGPAGATYDIQYETPATGIVNVPGAHGKLLASRGKYPPPPSGFVGSTGFPLQLTTVFTLNVEETVSGKTYHAQDQKTVTVEAPAPKIVSFTGGQIESKGGTARLELSWQLENADSFELDEKAGAHGQSRALPVPQDQSSFVVEPTVQPTTYTLRAMSSTTTKTDSKSVPVNIMPPVPVGSITAWFGSATSPIPTGWLLCDGKPFPGSTYPELQKLLGSDSTPDLQGYFLRGTDPAGTIDPDKNRPPGNVQQDAFEAHNHSITNSLYAWHRSFEGEDGQGIPYCQDTGNQATLTTNDSGVSSETRPKNVAVTYIICAGAPQS